MTPNEAVEELQSYDFLCDPTEAKKLSNAIRLGIEALKVRQAFIKKYGYENYILLPGETQEGENRARFQN